MFVESIMRDCSEFGMTFVVRDGEAFFRGVDRLPKHLLEMLRRNKQGVIDRMLGKTHDCRNCWKFIPGAACLSCSFDPVVSRVTFEKSQAVRTFRGFSIPADLPIADRLFLEKSISAEIDTPSLGPFRRISDALPKATKSEAKSE